MDIRTFVYYLGDNRIDGLELSEYVNNYTNIIPDYSGQKSKIPASWQYLFGHSAPVQMFWWFLV